MKKIILICCLIFTVILVVFFFFGKVTITANKETNLIKSDFYQNYYEKKPFVFVEVISFGSQSIKDNDNELYQLLIAKKIDYVTFLSKNSLSEVESILGKDKNLINNDKTLKNFDNLNEILELLEFKPKSTSFSVFTLTSTPYHVLLKNKKIIWKGKFNDYVGLKKILDSM